MKELETKRVYQHANGKFLRWGGESPIRRVWHHTTLLSRADLYDAIPQEVPRYAEGPGEWVAVTVTYRLSPDLPYRTVSEEPAESHEKDAQ